jgi:hypothetical protein
MRMWVNSSGRQRRLGLAFGLAASLLSVGFG